MKFVRMTDAQHIEQCPKQGISHGRIHTNLPRFYGRNPDLAAEDGYYPLTEQEKPEGYFTPRYTSDGVKIYQSWVPYTPEEPEADEPTIEERLDEHDDRIELVEDCILEVSEILFTE